LSFLSPEAFLIVACLLEARLSLPLLSSLSLVL
jgi:hypothetical protein